MPYTCSLDYVDDHGHGEMQHAHAVAKVLGVSRQRILVEVEAAQHHGRQEAHRRGMDTAM